MEHPLIGVTCSVLRDRNHVPRLTLPRAYLDALIQAGGVPVLVPSGLTGDSRAALYQQLDGILFSGGGDIAPGRYAGEPHPRIAGVDAERDAIELCLLDWAVADAKPFLGICRGFQLIAVGLGGSLYTHLPDRMKDAQPHDFHAGKPRNFLAHVLNLEPDSRLASILAESHLQVNSLHHQGVRSVPSALKQAAWAPDGLVEGLELPAHPFGMAVQWHPEELTDQGSMQRLFRAFVQAARQGVANEQR